MEKAEPLGGPVPGVDGVFLPDDEWDGRPGSGSDDWPGVQYEAEHERRLEAKADTSG